MKLTFLGAAGTVTGSKYLLDDGHNRILVDCGLYQGLKSLRQRNWEPLAINPATLDAVILTHAHLDHCGYLPRLVKEGFHGVIYCSEATYDLSEIIMLDSGRLQEEDANRANRYGYSKHHPAEALYTEAEAKKAMRHFRPVSLGDIHAIHNTDFRFSLHRAGHILGANFVKVINGDTSVLFSGDLGRMNDPVMKAPARIQPADYIVVESTYGDRLHSNADPADEICEVILQTIKRGGTVVIPSFAVGRAQSLMYYFHRLKVEGRIPAHLPIYLDSPMATDATKILQQHYNEHRLSRILCEDVCQSVKYIQTTDESKSLDAATNGLPCVIISASGMATGGRVLHHLKRFVSDARNTVLLAGFQAPGTRGDRLARGEKEIKIHGQMWPVNAQIVALESLSAHADYSEILHWLGHFPTWPRKVFVTHGELQAANSLKEKIMEQFEWDVVVPLYQQAETL